MLHHDPTRPGRLPMNNHFNQTGSGNDPGDKPVNEPTDDGVDNDVDLGCDYCLGGLVPAVAGMAGAARFRHGHDWTMHNSPTGTGDWFGWANAMVSELIPLAAGLEARRRHRRYGRAGAYPLALILGAVALSLTGQFAE